MGGITTTREDRKPAGERRGITRISHPARVRAIRSEIRSSDMSLLYHEKQ